MAEPASTTTGIAISAGAVTITGSLFGLGYESLIFGLIGSSLLVMHLPAASLGRTVIMVILGSLLAAGFAPSAVAAAISNWEWAKAMDATALRMGCALALGIAIPAIVPIIPALAKRKSESI